MQWYENISKFCKLWNSDVSRDSCMQFMCGTPSMRIKDDGLKEGIVKLCHSSPQGGGNDKDVLPSSVNTENDILTVHRTHELMFMHGVQVAEDARNPYLRASSSTSRLYTRWNQCYRRLPNLARAMHAGNRSLTMLGRPWSCYTKIFAFDNDSCPSWKIGNVSKQLWWSIFNPDNELLS